MTQSNGNGVRRVIRLGHRGQTQQPPGHILNLVLGGVSIAHHCLLDLHGLIFRQGQPRLLDAQQDHPPALGHIDAGGHVLSEKQFLNGHRIGFCHLQKLGHIVVNHFQPPGKRRIGRRGNGAAVQQPVTSPLGINQSETCNPVPRVNSQNPHSASASGNGENLHCNQNQHNDQARPGRPHLPGRAWNIAVLFRLLLFLFFHRFHLYRI